MGFNTTDQDYQRWLDSQGPYPDSGFDSNINIVEHCAACSDPLPEGHEDDDLCQRCEAKISERYKAILANARRKGES